MPPTITVPIDPDRGVPVALDVAVRVAAQANLGIDLVATPALGGVEYTGALLRERARLLQVRDSAAVTWHVLDLDQPPEAINRHVAAAGSDLLCLQTRATHGPRHLLFGSVAELVLHHAEVPVLLVGPNVTSAAARYRTVVACLDGSDEAAIALHVADRLRKAIGADLELVEVLDPSVAIPADTFEMAMLLRAAHGLHPEPVKYDVLHNRHPDDAIVEYVNDRDDVIVVTGTHNRAGLGSVLSGSVARDVVAASHHPVLVVPPVVIPERFLSSSRALAPA